MSMFVGNTFTKVEEVRSKYSEIEKYDVEEILSMERGRDVEVIYSTDFDNRIREIYDDVNKIIKLLKSHDTSDAIGELEILAEKLY